MKLMRNCLVVLIAVMAIQSARAGTVSKKSPWAGISEELAAAIEEIESSMEDSAERSRRIALLVSLEARHPGERSAILADLSRRVSVSQLPVVSAAAILSSGNASATILKAMEQAQDGDPLRTQALRQGAAFPVSILGTKTASEIQPVAYKTAAPTLAALASNQSPVVAPVVPVVALMAPVPAEVSPITPALSVASASPVAPSTPVEVIPVAQRVQIAPSLAASEPEDQQYTSRGLEEPSPPPFQAAFFPPPFVAPGLPAFQAPALPYFGQY